jgi:hypothetical protein
MPGAGGGVGRNGARAKNVFVLGLNEFNRAKLEAINGAEQCRFHCLLDPAKVVETYDFPMRELLGEARARLDRFGGIVDAIVGYWDFPISTMLPILCREYGVRSASLESVLKCEHKYWSRLEQRTIVPEHIPQVRLFDPFDPEALSTIDLPYPFWVKPIKSCGSYLGFRVRSPREFRRAVAAVRKDIHLISGPFDYIAEHAELPPEIAAVGGDYCQAESLIGGRQCTLDGYVQNGRTHIYGVVDSIRERNRSSFFRYEYPSQLPVGVRRRMQRIVERIMEHLGFDDSGFNAELFWHYPSDRIWLLEINTRITQSHSEIYEKVDGISNHQIMVDVALGREPHLPYREGPFACAGKFFLRTQRDALVRRVPSPEEIERLEREIPGTVVQLQVTPGMRLSELLEQDSYSYAIAHIFIGARSRRELLARYRQCLSMLPFELEECAATPPGMPAPEASAPGLPGTSPPATALPASEAGAPHRGE